MSLRGNGFTATWHCEKRPHAKDSTGERNPDSSQFLPDLRLLLCPNFNLFPQLPGLSLPLRGPDKGRSSEAKREEPFCQLKPDRM